MKMKNTSELPVIICGSAYLWLLMRCFMCGKIAEPVSISTIISKPLANATENYLILLMMVMM